MQHDSISALRAQLGWSQQTLADYLGVKQNTVSRMEAGQPPTGPVAKLLEQLQAEAPQRGTAA